MLRDSQTRVVTTQTLAAFLVYRRNAEMRPAVPDDQTSIRTQVCPYLVEPLKCTYPTVAPAPQHHTPRGFKAKRSDMCGQINGRTGPDTITFPFKAFSKPGVQPPPRSPMNETPVDETPRLTSDEDRKRSRLTHGALVEEKSIQPPDPNGSC
jgi:hypothetical protein